MKKIRYFPFGYQMVNGENEIIPEESVLLQKLFDSYLKGASLKKLADIAEETGIKFRENADHWNKNMIARILDDKRYWIGDGFPPIISRETGSAITDMRKQKSTSQSPIQFIQRKLFCYNCKGKIKRNSKNFPRIRWDCIKCGEHFGAMPDNELLQAVTEKLQAVCREPQMVEQEQTTGESLSMQAARLTNEINQALNRREVDPERVLPLILECAAEKYRTCHIKKSDYLTIKIKALFQEHSDDKKLDRELFEQTVKQVILQPDGSIQFRLLNGKTV